MRLGLNLALKPPPQQGTFGQGLSLSATTVPENTSPGTNVALVTPVRATGTVTNLQIDSQTVANAFAYAAGQLTVGSAGLNYEPLAAAKRITVTFSYDDDDGHHVFPIDILITDVADAPTETGASVTLASALAGATVGVATSFDARLILISPTNQALTFGVSHGSVAGDGFTINWTPSSGEFAVQPVTFILTATDADGQVGTAQTSAAITDVNDPITGGTITLTYEVPADTTAAVISGLSVSASATGGTLHYSVDEISTFSWIATTTSSYANAAAVVTAVQAAQGISRGQVSITVPGAQSDITVTGATGGVTYYVHAVSYDVAGNTPLITTYQFVAVGTPSAFTAGMWSITRTGVTKQMALAIATLPSNGGSAITDIGYKRDGGSYTTLARTTTGTVNITVPLDATDYNFTLHAVNANGTAGAGNTLTEQAEMDVSHHSTLPTSLVSYWGLEESSGSRADSKSTNTLTDNATVTFDTGKRGTAAKFTAANSEYLSRADNAALSITGSLSISAWVYFDTLPTAGNSMVVASKLLTTGAQRSYQLSLANVSGTYYWRMAISADGTAVTQADVAGSSITTGTWYHVTAAYTSGGSAKVEIYQGATLLGTVTSMPSAIFNSTASFRLGSTGIGGNYMDGRIDEVGLWSKAVSSGEVTDLDNGGAGMRYSVP